MVNAQLQDKKTGEVRMVRVDGSTAYMWEDGNYSCDCNRSIFFYSLPLDKSFPCGDTRFKLMDLFP